MMAVERMLTASASEQIEALKCRRWVIRDGIEPAASPAMSAMPPKAEVNSEH